MTSNVTPSGQRHAADHGLLLRESNHRSSNDLQLVIGLLALHGRRSASSEVRRALAEVTERVAALARARDSLHGDRSPSLANALDKVCEASRAHAEPRGVAIALQIDAVAEGLSATQVTTLALVVNELVTNAIKHAFVEGDSGTVRISICRNGSGDVLVFVEDDGRPFPAPGGPGSGLGLTLARRMMASIDGLLIPPSASPKPKVFELRVPSGDALPNSK